MRQRRSGSCTVKPSLSPTRSHRGRRAEGLTLHRLAATACRTAMQNLADKLSVASFESASAITRYEPAPLDGLGLCGLRLVKGRLNAGVVIIEGKRREAEIRR